MGLLLRKRSQDDGASFSERLSSSPSEQSTQVWSTLPCSSLEHLCPELWFPCSSRNRLFLVTRARLSLPAPLMEAQRGPAIFLKLHSKSAPEPGRAPPPLWTSRRSAPPGLTGWGGAPVSLSPFLTPQCGFSSPRTKCRTYHDVIPISCLTEFPNVVQMAKVRPLLHQAEPCWQPPWAQSWAAAWPLQTLSFSPKSWPGCCGLSLESCPFCVPLMPARWLCVWGTLWGTFWRQGPPVLPTLF